MTVTSLNSGRQGQPAVGERLCEHCGTPVRDPSERFCCGGCEFVYRSIHAMGLKGFYRLRETGAVARADKVEPAKSYAYLDDPEVAKNLLAAPSPERARVRFYLPTIHCPACIWLLEKLPHAVAGVLESRVSFRSGIIEVHFNPSVLRLSELARVLNSLGYPPVPATREASEGRDLAEDRAMLRRIGVAAVCAANTMMIADSLFQGASTGIEEPYRSLFIWASALIASPAVLYAAIPFYRAAIGAIAVGSLHIDIPISLAIIGSYSAGIVHAVRRDLYVYFDTITCLIFLLLLARYAQRRALHRARASVVSSWDLFPGTVRVVENGAVTQKRLRELSVGEIVEVLPGERIPSDGRVIEGRSSVEAAFLTGESMPHEALPGETVLGGSINVEGTLRVQVEAVGEKSRLGKILSDLEHARDKRTPLESKIQLFTNYFVTAVLIASVLAGAVWWVLAPERAFDIALSLLIVTCPCALGLAIPTAITVALARAQKSRIFVKNAHALQILGEARHFYFDKTGTLTEGRLSVQDSRGSEEARHLAAGLARSAGTHPVARAVAHSAAGAAAPANARVVPGKGVEAQLVGGESARLGSLRWCKERGVELPPEIEHATAAWLASGATVSVLDVGGEATAAFALKDAVRPDAREAVENLQAAGAEVFVLSGDSQAVVDRLAQELGIPADHARGELDPEAKARIVAADRELTVMVGDGLNDAGAMRTCDVGIGLSGGIEATLECADIFVAEGDLRGFWRLYRGACDTRGVIRRNLAYSVVYNIIGGGLALAGHITPLLAAVIMPISSITVILSSISSRHFAAREGR